jgi:uncharacterized membrane protein
VQVVHIDQLLAAAASRRVHVRMRPRIGEHVVAGTPVAWYWPARPDPPPPPVAIDGCVDDAVRIGFERTLEQDPGLGLRQLVDLACKALSPAVNDPYTAIQSVERLSVLYMALAARPLGPIVAHDPAGEATVTIPSRSFAEHLTLGVGLIRRYGAAEPTVVQALLRLLGTVLMVCADADRLLAIETQVDLLVAAAARSVAEEADLALVHAEAETVRKDLARRRGGVASSSLTGVIPSPPTPPPA